MLDRPPRADPEWDSDIADPSTSNAPYRIYNVGAQQPLDLSRFVEVLEACLGRKARKNLLPLQPGDVPETWGDVTELAEDFDFQPATTVEDGIKRFVDWYLDFYGIGS